MDRVSQTMFVHVLSVLLWVLNTHPCVCFLRLRTESFIFISPVLSSLGLIIAYRINEQIIQQEKYENTYNKNAAPHICPNKLYLQSILIFYRCSNLKLLSY